MSAIPSPPSPDARAECLTCGALTRVEFAGRHVRYHEWLDELERRLQVLEDSGGETELVQFGQDGLELGEPLMVPVPDGLVRQDEPAPAEDLPDDRPEVDDDFRHFSRF